MNEKCGKTWSEVKRWARNRVRWRCSTNGTKWYTNTYRLRTWVGENSRRKYTENSLYAVGGVPLQARCGPEGSRRFRLPDFNDIRHMKVARSSASCTGHLHLQEMFLVLIFTRGWVDPRAIVRSEGNMSLKNPVTPSGIDPGTVRLVAQRLNH